MDQAWHARASALLYYYAISRQRFWQLRCIILYVDVHLYTHRELAHMMLSSWQDKYEELAVGAGLTTGTPPWTNAVGSVPLTPTAGLVGSLASAGLIFSSGAFSLVVVVVVVVVVEVVVVVVVVVVLVVASACSLLPLLRIQYAQPTWWSMVMHCHVHTLQFTALPYESLCREVGAGAGNEVEFQWDSWSAWFHNVGLHVQSHAMSEKEIKKHRCYSLFFRGRTTIWPNSVAGETLNLLRVEPDNSERERGVFDVCFFVFCCNTKMKIVIFSTK